MGRPKYSICMTTYNTIKTIDKCFKSLLRQIDDRFEIIVVDNLSSDGTEKYLEKLALEGKIRLIKRKCSRGLGRQIAAENALGDVLIQQVDADQVYGKFLNDAVEFFEKESVRDPEVLVFIKEKRKIGGLEREPSTVSIVYRNVFLSKTRWPDINYGEDQHVYDPFIKGGHIREFFVYGYAVQLKGNIVSQMANRFAVYQQYFMSGFNLAQVTYSTKYHSLLFFVRAFYVHITYLYFLIKNCLRV
ncbi:MAG: glycosyltransferase family 2 protein [Nitrososphaeria archaeon]